MFIHHKLVDHLNWYAHWHEKTSHPYWHWLSFGLIVFICFYLILNQSALTYLEINNLSKTPLQPKVAAASTNSFDERKQEYINFIYTSGWDPCTEAVGGDIGECIWGGDRWHGWLQDYSSEALDSIWAWLATHDTLDYWRKDVITKIVRQWGHTGSPNSSIPERDWPEAWGNGVFFSDYLIPSLQLFRIRWQYPQAVESELDWIDDVFKNKASVELNTAFSLNNRLMQMTIRYLANEKYFGQIDPTSQNWLYSTFDQLTSTGAGDNEMDSEYTKTFVTSLYTLYDFTTNREMKNRAKMMLDFLLLDSIMEVSGGLHGGPPGRTYKESFLGGNPRIYYWVYWGIPPDPSNSQVGESFDSYLSSYRLPELIRDIGRLDDEPDNYWHWDMENNHSAYCPSTGKAVYVTKYYNLGGCDDIGWLLNIASANSDYGIRIWINRQVNVLNEVGYFTECLVGNVAPNGVEPLDGRRYHFCPISFGQTPYDQDKDAMSVPSGSTHILDTQTGKIYEQGDDTGNLFDRDETINGWRFLVEGNAAVAISSNRIKTAVINVEGTNKKGFYNSYNDFKTAVLNNSEAFSPAPDYQLPRLEVVDNNGEYIVKWDEANRTATVKRHGLECKYNFNNWSYSGDCGGPAAELDQGDNGWSTWYGGGRVDGGYRGGGLNRTGNGISSRSASQIKANFNCDSKGVDIQDFGILLSHWGKTTGLNNYTHSSSGCSKNLDLSVTGQSANKIDKGDMAALLSCWGTPSNDACYPAGSSPSSPSIPSTPSTPSTPATPTPAPTFPSTPISQGALNKTDVLSVMQSVNDYWISGHPDPDGNKWARSSYFTGNMALYETSHQQKYLDYALDWAEQNNWAPGTDPPGPWSADNHCCGQTYIDLYKIEPNISRISQIKDIIDGMVDGGRTSNWHWVDALFMDMPVFARLGALYNDSNYFDKMYDLYIYAKTTFALYNPNYGLWYRDQSWSGSEDITPSGEKIFWSRGNGWALAALVRTLQLLPNNDPHRDEYTTTYLEMAAALKNSQRSDGFWGVNLADINHYPGPETSGTSLFTYGLAWGINNGLLDSNIYYPVVLKAWNGLINTAVHPNGFLGYVQGSGSSPGSSQPVTYDSTADFGVGAFLLAGSEVYKLAN